jgi:hypothetical protein
MLMGLPACARQRDKRIDRNVDETQVLIGSRRRGQRQTTKQLTRLFTCLPPEAQLKSHIEIRGLS